MPFAAVGAGVGAIGSLIGGGKQADAMKQAATIQSDAANKATALQQQEFQTIQGNEAPYLKAGYNGLDMLQTQLPRLLTGFDPTSAGLPSKFSFDPASVANDPAYQFALQQGTQALQRSQAARGGLLGGAGQKELAQYTAGVASQYENQDFGQALNTYQTNFGNAFNTFQTNQNNVFNRLSALSAAGQTGIQQVNAAGENFANNAANNIIGAGNAQAAARIGSTNAMTSGYAGAASAFGGLMNNTSFQTSLKNWMGGLTNAD